MRWGIPEPSELGEYEQQNIDGASVYVHHAVRGAASARIDVVTGGVGTKLILLGFAGHK
ncbi:hypothetical protein [Anaeroselena agilis]|uniref:Uncharacterized protein n=1 Tax=Anaeroselena agilis TaxID=3063788 RepID=A0ABU3NZ46_9FIRM|nr:hypothetical protein [Selenomonadales bacterium 4137-cl]